MTTRSSAVYPAAVTGVRVAIGRPLLVALGAGMLGAVLLAVAPVLAIAGADDGAATGPAYSAGPVLALLAVGPAALAWLLAARGRAATAAGLLTGLAALAPGRAALDLQLLVAPWRAARPELLVSTSLAPLHPGPGAWMLLFGHVLTAAAGVLAAFAVRRAAPPVDAAFTAPRSASPALVAALFLAVLAAAGLAAAPFRSADPFLLPRAAVDAPLLVKLGVLLLAAGVVLAAALAAGAADAAAGRGALLGVALGIVAVTLPVLLAALLSPSLTVNWGPPVALVAAVGLAGTARLVGPDGGPAGTTTEELRLPTLNRLHAAAGATAVLAGLAALAGAVVDQVSVPVGMAEPVLYSTRLLLPAGLLYGVLGVALLFGAGAQLRPALAVAWAGIALAGMATLDGALTATQIGGVEGGTGVWATAVALLVAPSAGCLAAVAGSVEREEVDLTELHATPPRVIAGVLAAALAVPAFGLPLQSAPDYAEAGLWSNFQVGSWGLLAAAVAVVVAALLAPWSRPSRAVGLLLGAAAVLAVHLARLPLTGDRAGDGASVAAGTWFGLACLVALGTAAVLAWHGQRSAPSTLPTVEVRP